MVKIWYSVFGEGYGHAIRSNTIIDKLRKKHKIIITACDKAYPYLKKKHKNVHKIKGAGFVYKSNQVDIGKTIREFLNTYPEKTKKNIKHIFNLIKRFKPDIIISDFEPISHYFALFLGIPIISIDNINILEKCKTDIGPEYWFDFLNAKQLIKLINPYSDYFIIPSIINLQPKYKDVFIVPPVLREKILEKKPVEKDFILVYQSSSTYKKLLNELKKIDKKFVIYGLGKNKKDKNLVFKDFSERGFIKDLKNCKAAIVNGGFTTISEAIYFKKPVLAVPLKNQFEQVFNGKTIKKLGYGTWYKELDKNKIKKFLSQLKKYKKNLGDFEKKDNKELFDKLDYLIGELSHRKKPVFEFVRKIEKQLRWPKYERTLTIIKPDAIESSLVGEVIKKLEKKQINPVGMKMVKLNKKDAEKFYSHLKTKIPEDVFDSIIDYITSNRVIVIVWQGKGVVKKVRKTCGPTNPKEAGKRTIRSLSKEDMGKEFRKGKAVKNIIHSSSNSKEAKKEIKFFFKPWEIYRIK